MTLLLPALLAAVSLAVPAASATVEQRFAATGPATVATTTVDTRFVIIHPADLGATRHPIVTWGNGSNATPAQYTGLMRHLASWGFVVIASASTTTASGAEMLAAVEHLRAADEDPASPFAGRLATDRVAAAGHSQGAGGAARAALARPDLIHAAVTVNPPDAAWIPDAEEPDLSRVGVPVLLVTGARDLWVSPPRTLTWYYDRIPGTVTRAALLAADHNTIQGAGGGYLGYLTAWLRWQLTGDGTAAPAFTGADPELLRNPAWTNRAVKPRA